MDGLMAGLIDWLVDLLNSFVLRSRVDLYWSVPLPNLCRFSTTSLTGFSDYFHLFPAPLVRHMGNVWAAFARASCGGGGEGGGGGVV